MTEAESTRDVAGPTSQSAQTLIKNDINKFKITNLRAQKKVTSFDFGGAR